jgi:hemolysin activation/secretion protein
VSEANRYRLSAQIADDQSPTVGAVRSTAGFGRKHLGFQRCFESEYGRSQGRNDGYVAYSVPIASDDTTVSLRYDRKGTIVVTPALTPLNITSSFTDVGVGLSRPMYRTSEAVFVLGASLERRESQTLFVSMPFPITPGTEPNGVAQGYAVSHLPGLAGPGCRACLRRPINLQLWAPKPGRQGDSSPPPRPCRPANTSRGSAIQYVRQIFSDWEILVRSDLQLANRPLFQMEQIAFGGLGSVRGYRTYLTVTDYGFLASGELWIPVGRPRLTRRLG